MSKMTLDHNPKGWWALAPVWAAWKASLGHLLTAHMRRIPNNSLHCFQVFPMYSQPDKELCHLHSKLPQYQDSKTTSGGGDTWWLHYWWSQLPGWNPMSGLHWLYLAMINLLSIPCRRHCVEIVPLWKWKSMIWLLW
jgi:hypothetical protein